MHNLTRPPSSPPFAHSSPVIKFIDFGGASTCTAEGLTGLVGTPQYVAPEVVTGFGENDATGAPYGKGCDIWSMGVLLYVMLSKTMPFRAKEVDQLLKQVVRAKFNFRPEEKWKPISGEAKDLISKMLVKDPTKRLNIQQVKAHPWCAEAISRTIETMPKMELEKEKSVKEFSLFKPMLRVASGVGKVAFGQEPKVEIVGKPKNKGVSREQQYWYAMEISPPSNMKQEGGVRVGADGQIEMDGSVPPEMRALLEEIQKAKAQRAGSGGSPAGVTTKKEFVNLSTGGTPPPPGPPPAPGGGGMPPPPAGPPPVDLSDPNNAAMVQLTTENEAALHTTTKSEAMETMLLMSAKDSEIQQLKKDLEVVTAQLQAAIAAKSAAAPSTALPQPTMTLGNASEAVRAAEERADKAEAEVAELKAAMTKVRAKLNAVSTLYTEAAQREAVLRLQLEQSTASSPPVYQ